MTIPTAAQETNYIWRTIRDIVFFEQHQYQLSLPKGRLIEALKKKARAKQLSDEDYVALKKFVTDKVYQEADYQKGYQLIKQNEALLNRLIKQLSKNSPKNWKFKMFDTYRVTLTLYGSGGSYDPDRGSIIIFATRDGKFKQYKNPANTIIHEITHIGIEYSIIRKHKVPHGLKERIVDTFVLLNFKKYLPEYYVQNMGDKRLDTYLKHKKDLDNLEEVVKKVLKKK
ncbi:hypothetical protein M23134_04110 [Microscilla marina ATCC 23134]|uniref:Uncharacterized protein n=1 Tax=Microscilla marina ATCC 23134 TaxID=313606 RepID=A1ZDW9_MICM2|nr:hypothetical protein M23134_04110 [Microscilla marina ATCC 23134]